MELRIIFVEKKMKRKIKFRAWAWGFMDYNPRAYRDNLNECMEDNDIMQFTGLKDKNGKDIYEGDIIEMKHAFKGRYHKGVVEMIDWRWTMRNFFQGQLDIPNEPFSEGTHYIEVIGNIYENPELLK